MRHGIATAGALLLAACAAPGGPPPPALAAAPPHAAAPRALELRNPGFEDEMKSENRCALGWDCTMHNNPDSFRFSLLQAGAAAGRRSLCVERVVDEPWALVTQALQTPVLRGQRLRLSMAVRVEGVTGEGAGPWVLAQARSNMHTQKLVRGTRPWERVEVEFTVPADATVVQVGATLEGPGKACFDDVRLEARTP